MTTPNIITYASLEVKGPIKMAQGSAQGEAVVLDSEAKIPSALLHITNVVEEAQDPVTSSAVKTRTDNLENDYLGRLELKQDRLPVPLGPDTFLKWNGTDLTWEAVQAGVSDVKVNGSSVVSYGVAEITIPDTSEFITKDVSNLTYYMLTSDINTALSGKQDVFNATSITITESD